jgi:hypothetical protein
MIASATARPRPILANLLLIAELVIRRLAAFHSKNSQLDLLAFWERRTVPTSGLCPHEGRFDPKAFRDVG